MHVFLCCLFTSIPKSIRRNPRSGVWNVALVGGASGLETGLSLFEIGLKVCLALGWTTAKLDSCAQNVGFQKDFSLGAEGGDRAGLVQGS